MCEKKDITVNIQDQILHIANVCLEDLCLVIGKVMKHKEKKH